MFGDSGSGQFGGLACFVMSSLLAWALAGLSFLRAHCFGWRIIGKN